ncbi:MULTISPECIES: CvpA family protein [Rhodomicrobium]|uniref:CvpA family protein n=1 Tax=Rhodomicrobium TaxID=1068 RepID=UPI001483930F|nr:MULTISPECIES: CvpA family protein [Rhodomicrobium]
MSMPIQWLDVILVVIMLISAFLAMLRGLTREMLSIMSWAFAALAALFIYPLYRDKLRQMIQPDILADGVLIATVFVIVLIVVSLITVRLSDRVLDSRVGALDRTLGFVFGLARGLILVVIAYELLVAIMPKETLPKWVTEARSLTVIESTGRAIISLLPDNPASMFGGQRAENIREHKNLAALYVLKVTYSGSYQRYNAPTQGGTQEAS